MDTFLSDLFFEIENLFLYSEFLISLFLSLISTLIIESLLCIPLIKKKKLYKKDLVDLALINCLTNPSLVVIFNIFDYLIGFIYRSRGIYTLLNIDGFLFLTVMEIFIVFIEGWLLKNLIPRLSGKSLKYSLYLNGFSYLSSYVFMFLSFIF